MKHKDSKIARNEDSHALVPSSGEFAQLSERYSGVKTKASRLFPSSESFPGAIPVNVVTLGNVTIQVPVAKPADIRRNIKQGQTALARARDVLVEKHGARIVRPRGVPLYKANPTNPQIIIRTFDGKVEQGVFVDGKFKVLP